MFCSNCGSKVDDNAKFCMKCGNQLQKAEKTYTIPTETKLVPARCTACGASVKVNPDMEIADCPYCGSSYIVEKAINTFNVENGNFNIENATINVIMSDDNIRAKKKDSLFAKAGMIIVEKQKGSTALLQRTLTIDYTRANDIMLQLEEAGVVGPMNGAQRKVLMTVAEFQSYLKNNHFI